VKIQAWENHEKRKAEMEKRKMEVWLLVHSRQNYFIFDPLLSEMFLFVLAILTKSRVPKSCVAPIAILLEEMNNNKYCSKNHELIFKIL
jgi:hypothetical protein